ncbi:histone H1-like protein HC2 isoform X1 [Linepithema humile]|uniref:histone H1-like protein HC2 isoform X1 n=1 Tax=Linepithema humile TaxID=83485 RepID=UPI00351DC3A1
MISALWGPMADRFDICERMRMEDDVSNSFNIVNILLTNKINTIKLQILMMNEESLLNGDVDVDVDLITAHSVAARSVAARSVAVRDVAAGSVAAGPVAAGPVAAGPVAAGPVAAGPVAAGSVAARSVAARSVAVRDVAAGLVAAGPVAADSVAAGSVAAGSVAAGSVAAGPVAAGSMSKQNRQDYRPRGRAAGARRQQERFMKFLYQLSMAPHHWGRHRGRGRGRRNN